MNHIDRKRTLAEPLSVACNPRATDHFPPAANDLINDRSIDVAPVYLQFTNRQSLRRDVLGEIRRSKRIG